jgi:hypothetical protein
LDYEGNGVNEYQYYDRRKNKWSDAACQAAGTYQEVWYDMEDEDDAVVEEEDAEGGVRTRRLNSNATTTATTTTAPRCVKMDCHLPSTHFHLLGIFKEPNYENWMDQLFQYEGDCVWDDEELTFMQHDRSEWIPSGCTESLTSNSAGGYLYYDLKPAKYGKMDIGLYTDEKCIEDYIGTLTVQEVLMAAGHSGSYSSMTLAQELEEWNDAFDVWKQCQPCKASNLLSIVAGRGTTYNSTGTRQSWSQARGGSQQQEQEQDEGPEAEQQEAVQEEYTDFSCMDNVVEEEGFNMVCSSCFAGGCKR